MRVMVVDDDEGIRQLLEMVLEEEGYEVVASDDVGAIKVAQASKPDLILLDLTMPTLSGDEICKQLRAMPATATTPVVAMSGIADLAAKTSAMAVNGCLSKPFQLSTLAEVVARWAVQPGPEDVTDDWGFGAPLLVSTGEQAMHAHREALHCATQLLDFDAKVTGNPHEQDVRRAEVVARLGEAWRTVALWDVGIREPLPKQPLQALPYSRDWIHGANAEEAARMERLNKIACKQAEIGTIDQQIAHMRGEQETATAERRADWLRYRAWLVDEIADLELTLSA